MLRRAILFLLAAVPIFAQAPTGSLDFHVVSRDNAPIAGASVTLEGPNKQTYSGSTERDGHLRLENLAPGVYRFTSFDAAGYIRSPRMFLADLSIQAGQTREFQFELQPAPQLEGTVLDQNGKPVSGAIVTAWMWEVQEWSAPVSATTDANGAYAVTLRATPASFLAPHAILVRSVSVEAALPREAGRFDAQATTQFSAQPNFTNARADLQLRLETASIR